MILQTAALNVSQFLASEAGILIQPHCDESALLSDGSISRNASKKVQLPSPPLSPTVGQLTEMGFSRRNVECAIKALGECDTCLCNVIYLSVSIYIQFMSFE